MYKEIETPYICGPNYSKKYRKVACVGATGLVGTVMCEVLEERGFRVTEFIPVASERSAGNTFIFMGKEYTPFFGEAVAKNLISLYFRPVWYPLNGAKIRHFSQVL